MNGSGQGIRTAFPELEDVLLSQDPEFWKLIEARRKQPTLSIKDVRARLVGLFEVRSGP